MEENYKILREKLNSSEFEVFFDEKLLGLAIYYEKKRKKINYIFFTMLALIFIAAIVVMVFVYAEVRFPYIIGIAACTVLFYLYISRETQEINEKLMNTALQFLGNVRQCKNYEKSHYKSYIRAISALPQGDDISCDNCIIIKYKEMEIIIMNIAIYKKNFGSKHSTNLFSGMAIIVKNLNKINSGNVIIKNKQNRFCSKKEIKYLKKINIEGTEELNKNYDIYAESTDTANEIITDELINGLNTLKNEEICKEDIAISYESGSITNIILRKYNNLCLSIFSNLDNINIYKNLLNEVISYIAFIDILKLDE